MAVGLTPPARDALYPVPGAKLGIASAGIRKADRKDLLLLTLAEGSTAAGLFTRNRFCAAPVLVCREHLRTGMPMRAIVVNTGNANAGNAHRCHSGAHAQRASPESRRAFRVCIWIPGPAP